MSDAKYKCPASAEHQGVTLIKMPDDCVHNWRLSCGVCGEFIKWASNREAEEIHNIQMLDEIKELVKAVFKQDKTPDYGYSGKERDADRFGNLPDAGKRWATPAELAMDFARRHKFDTELWERSEDDG